MKSKLPNLRNLNRPTRIIVIVIVILGLWLGIDSHLLNSVVSFVENHPPGYYTVANVVDGDTIEVNMNGRLERVRFIGLDTPEKNHPDKPVQCFAEAAGQYLAGLIGHEPVRLELDPTNQNRDRYDRLLRYVYLEDGTLLNAQLIAEGYGFAYTAFPFERMEEFRRLEREAREASRGLWNSCGIEQENGFINTAPEL